MDSVCSSLDFMPIAGPVRVTLYRMVPGPRLTTMKETDNSLDEFLEFVSQENVLKFVSLQALTPQEMPRAPYGSA